MTRKHDLARIEGMFEAVFIRLDRIEALLGDQSKEVKEVQQQSLETATIVRHRQVNWPAILSSVAALAMLFLVIAQQLYTK